MQASCSRKARLGLFRLEGAKLGREGGRMFV